MKFVVTNIAPDTYEYELTKAYQTAFRSSKTFEFSSQGDDRFELLAESSLDFTDEVII